LAVDDALAVRQRTVHRTNTADVDTNRVGMNESNTFLKIPI